MLYFSYPGQDRNARNVYGEMEALITNPFISNPHSYCHVNYSI